MPGIASAQRSRDSGLEWPLRRIVVNLSPGNLPKDVPGLDFPIAMGVRSRSFPHHLKRCDAGPDARFKVGAGGDQHGR
jgi:hypothetical protein